MVQGLVFFIFLTSVAARFLVTFLSREIIFLSRLGVYPSGAFFFSFFDFLVFFIFQSVDFNFFSCFPAFFTVFFFLKKF